MNLAEDSTAPTEGIVTQRLQRESRKMQGRISRDGLAIVKSAYSAHIAQNPRLLAQVMRLCQSGTCSSARLPPLWLRKALLTHSSGIPKFDGAGMLR